MPLYWHTLGNRALTTFSNFFTDRSFTDVHTCYKVFRADVIKAVNLEEDRFAFDPEITLKLARSKTRIFEVPISYNGRSYAEGKKIGVRDLARAMYANVKYGLRRGELSAPPQENLAEAAMYAIDGGCEEVQPASGRKPIPTKMHEGRCSRSSPGDPCAAAQGLVDASEAAGFDGCKVFQKLPLLDSFFLTWREHIRFTDSSRLCP